MSAQENKWLLVKNDYFSGISPQQLSEKYQINYQTIRSRIKREDWVSQKNQLTIVAMK